MAPVKKLTNRQAQVLRFIIDQVEHEGYPPTIREIGDHLGIKSTNGVNDHLKALEKKRYLSREDAKSRALKPLRETDGTPYQPAGAVVDETTAYDEHIHSVPVVGRIAAGLPSAAVEHTEEFLRIGEGLLGRGDDIFGLRVRGESMIEDGIHDGDYIFVKRQHVARDGTIVAAMVDGEATVKRLYREGDRLRLQPANASMEPIYVHASDARETCVLGRVVAVFRKL